MITVNELGEKPKGPLHGLLREVPVWQLACRILGVIALFAGAIFLRFRGIDWDNGNLLHPDERFLTMVQGVMRSNPTWAQFFDSNLSTLNPHNLGYPFFVYGTLPLFILQKLEVLFSGLKLPLHLYGRAFSAFSDTVTVLLVFLIAGTIRSGSARYWAAALSAGCALQIQQAHFGVVDSFGAMVVTAVIFLCTLVAKYGGGWKLRWVMGAAIIIGLFLGMAGGTKVNLLLVALPVPISFFIARCGWWRSVAATALAAVVTIVTFRLCQPYAFTGPGLFDISLNPKWLANMKEIKRLAVPSLGFPPAVQWMERSVFFGIYHMLVWGLGLPLGILSIASYVVALRRIIIGREVMYLPLMLWISVAIVVFGFWLSNPTLRYLLPAYPGILVLSGILVSDVLSGIPRWWGLLAKVGVVLLAFLGVCWGFAVSSIYARPHSRVAASDWIIFNIPGPISLEGRSSTGGIRYPVPISQSLGIDSQAEQIVPFGVREDFQLEAIFLPKVRSGGAERPIIDASIESDGVITAQIRLEAAADNRSLIGVLPSPVILGGGRSYLMRLRNVGGERVSVEHYLVAHETSWDDGLPLRVRGFDPYGGIFKGLDEMGIYWPEGPQKFARMRQTLEQADLLFMTSNRQWGSVPRLESTFPVTADFYRRLADCLPDESVPDCYSDLYRRTPRSRLPFRLIGVFTSFPTLAGIAIPDQRAEEAFTVYDHPAVYLFAKDRPLTDEDLQWLPR